MSYAPHDCFHISTQQICALFLYVPSWLRNNHLSPSFVKFTPQILRVKSDFGVVILRFLRPEALQPPRVNRLLPVAESCVQRGVHDSFLRQRLGQRREVRVGQRREQWRLRGGEVGRGTWPTRLERMVVHVSRMSHQGIRTDGTEVSVAGHSHSPLPKSLEVLKHDKDMSSRTGWGFWGKPCKLCIRSVPRAGRNGGLVRSPSRRRGPVRDLGTLGVVWSARITGTRPDPPSDGRERAEASNLQQ